MMYILGICFIFCSISFGQVNFKSYFESQLTVEFDSTQTKNQTGSFIRFNSQIDGKIPVINNSYSLTGGGVFLENFNESQHKIYPEWKFLSFFTPLSNFKFKLFSQNIQYSPRQYMHEPYSNSESIHGIDFQYTLSNSKISIQNGIRTIQSDQKDVSYNFSNIDVLHRNKHVSINLSGNINSTDSLSYVNKKLILNSHIKNGTQQFMYLTDNTDLFQFESGLTSGNIPITENQKLQWQVSKIQRIYEDHSVINQDYIFKHDLELSPIFTIETKVESEWDNVDDVDASHWRQYHTGVHWKWNKPIVSVNGGLSFGFREDAIFGNGISSEASMMTSSSPLHNSMIYFGFSHSVDGSILYPIDSESIDNLLYEFNSNVNANIELIPNYKWVPGGSIQMNNHFGSNLHYAPDTLQNIVNTSIFTRYRNKNIFLKFSTTKHLNMKDDSNFLIYSCDYSIQQSKWFGFNGYVRYQDKELDIITFRSSVSLNLGENTISMDIDNSGKVEDVSKINSIVWIRFVRKFG